MAQQDPPKAPARRAFTASGQVQGVGFRPFVWRLATEGRLTGSVRNTADGVRIEVQGEASAVVAFGRRLREELPPLARLTGVIEAELAPVAGEAEFRILESEGAAGHTVLVSPDVAICEDCLAEMRDPADRRFGYAFTNCTNCGPRFTITRSIPYDRAVTSMACFPLCPACAGEYTNPADRRFHAQPIACPECGPRLWFVDAGAAGRGPEATGPTPENRADALARAGQLLLDGGILALKGLGGFQLLCDARNEKAVATLRRRKSRPHKALAVLAHDLAAAREACRIGPAAERLLTGTEKPIVICPRREDRSALPDSIAPDSATVGLMLPYTPLHAALCDWLATHGAAPLLVATSGNPHGEPLCLGNREALARLADMADGWLLHDRDVLVRVDDSVVMVPEEEDAAPLPVRRARGYVPRPVALAQFPGAEGEAPCVFGAGAGLKAAFCLTRGREAFMGQHIGDLESPATLGFYDEAAQRLEELLEVRPEALVCDLHPDFPSSRRAEERAQREGLPLYRLQHHAAHAAAILAEHGVTSPALALCLDGTGLGTDGTIWGGELLFMDLSAPEWRRLGRLSPFALPGGEAAIREPWRIACSLARLSGLEWSPEAAPPDDAAPAAAALAAVDALLDRGLNSPATSSCGRLFDAVAAALGLCTAITYEGQAAIRLESAARAWLAAHGGELPEPWAVPLREGEDGLLTLDSAALFAEVLRARRGGRDAGEIAARFHASLARGFADMTARAAEKLGLLTVGLSGGSFQNLILSARLREEFAARGLTPLSHAQVPLGDGGLALGQAVWGARMLAQGRAPA
ncbi:MAG: carbamoyltransferase HypF [Desulfovibrio sp.]|uniref:carbamoyltransferase HypF n=1 Tax=Desulfovibrio sp. TaxID=885 RepID=UPI001A7830F2|nr:carbamoyltransferase HypF [Desulfovibrio sp.]MBD5416807.1 carbamoyltransferase HypF [Desulfovibrio sp.]